MTGQGVLPENEDENYLLLDNLPSEILYQLFQYCDIVSLGRLSQVCKRFSQVVIDVWEALGKQSLATNQVQCGILGRSFRVLNRGEKCRISKNWTDGRYREHRYLVCSTRYMPWLCLCDKMLWISRGNVIRGYKRTKKGLNISSPHCMLRGHAEDVCRFVVHGKLLFSGGRDGAICVWCCEKGNLMFYKADRHTSNVNAIDYNGSALITGSRDKTVKIWTAVGEYEWQDEVEIYLGDTVWSVATSIDGDICAVGTAGHNRVPPLHFVDLNRPDIINAFERDCCAGAGVLDMHWESPNILLSAGYDTHVRLWDLRTGTNVCSWMDPFDSAIYSLSSDSLYTILCGTALHGRVQLWDKRHTQSKQMYYMSIRDSSPVYSLSFDPCQLFVALDQSVHCLDFTNSKNFAVDYVRNNSFLR